MPRTPFLDRFASCCGFLLRLLCPVLVPPVSFVLSLFLGLTYVGIAHRLIVSLCNEVRTRAVGIGANFEMSPVVKNSLDQVRNQAGFAWYQLQREWRAVEQQGGIKGSLFRDLQNRIPSEPVVYSLLCEN
jgi:hypothetical protein